MADATRHTYLDAQAPGYGREQKRKVILESGNIVQNDWMEYVLDEADDAQGALPAISVAIYTHDGGITNTVNDNWNVSAGDTLIMEFWDPDNQYNDTYRERADGGYTEVTHELSGGTDTAYTNAQVAASLNADTEFSKWAYATIGVTADRVTIVPKGRRGRCRVTGGTANSVLVFAGTEVDNSTRIFTLEHIVAADWTITYNASTKALRILNANATAFTRVLAIATLH